MNPSLQKIITATMVSLALGSKAAAYPIDQAFRESFPASSSAAPAGQSTGARRFDIPAGRLDVALAAFSKITGITVTVSDPAMMAITTAGVSGVFTVEAALQRLLAGTSLSARFTTPTSAEIQFRSGEETVTVRGMASVSSPKYTEPLRDTPQTITVIPQRVFQEQGATSLRDVLRNTPGVTLTAGEGGTAPGDNVLIRGFSARNDVYIDGARDPGVTSRDTFNTEAVEVAKGPSSVTAGRGSTGGSVNLVTKSAGEADFATLRVIGGNADYKRGTLDVNRRVADGVAVRLNGMWQDAGVPRRDAVTETGWGIAPRVGVGIGRPTSFALGYQHQHQNNVPDYGLPGTLPALAEAAGVSVKDLDFSNFYGLLSRDYEKFDADVATAIVTHRFSGATSLRNLTRYGRNSLDRVVTPPRAASAANGGADPGYDATVPQIRRTDTKYQYRTDRTIANQTDLTSSFGTGAVRHDTAIGVELSGDLQRGHAATDTFANGRPPVTDLFHPDPSQPYTPSIVPTGATTEARARSAAAYAFDTMKLGRWQLDLGGRYDHIDVRYETLSAAGAKAALGRTDDAFSGRGGLVFKPTPRGSLYGAVSTSFNPSYDGSFGLTLGAAGGNSQALPPERSRNFEIGAKFDVGAGLSLTGAAFRTAKTNAKTTDASGATVLAGDQRVNGLEFGLAGNITPRWSVFSGFSLMNGRIKDSGNAAEVDKQLAYVPKSSFNIWSSYRLGPAITVGGGAQYTAGYYFNNTNALTTANAIAINDLTEYWLFGAMAGVRLNKHLSLQINGTNLANARYVERGYSGHFLPGPGRAIRFGPVISF